MKIAENLFISELKKGNEKAFDEIFRQYYRGLCMFAKKYLNDLAKSEEVVQDVFLRFWEKREQIELKTSVKTYLFTSVRNGCIDIIRKDNVRMRYSNKISQESPLYYNTDQEVFPDKNVIHKVKKIVNAMPRQRKRIFQMNRYFGFKYREIAEKLNISQKTVENQMGKALKQLREELSGVLA